MKKRKNAKTQKREIRYKPIDLSNANAVTIKELREKMEIQSLTDAIKLLQKIRRDKLAQQRRNR